MKTQAKFCVCCTKVSTFFSAAPVLSLIPSVGPSRNTKTLFFRLSVCDHKASLKLQSYHDKASLKLQSYHLKNHH